MKTRAPRVQTNSNNTRISGHELIASVYGSVGYSATKVPINPGLPMFTWLSQQAHGWEKYKFLKLELVYVPSNAVTTTPGSVFLAADYDAEDPVPADLQALSTYETQASGKVYTAVSLSPPYKRLNDVPGHKFIRDTAVAAKLSLYDPCSFTIATIDCVDTSALGQLWVNYEVELISPQSQVRVLTVGGLAQFSSVGTENVSSGVDTKCPFDTRVSENLKVESDVNNVDFTAPKGVYKVRSVVDVASADPGVPVSAAFHHTVDGIILTTSKMYRNWTTNALSAAYTLVLESIVNLDGTQVLSTVLATTAVGALTARSRGLTFRSLDR